MMDLVLWRHADAEDAGDGMPDLERRLTARGEREATRIALWLHRQLPQSTRILASPAERAQRTAMKLSRKFKTVAEIGPEASAAQILQAAGWPHARRPIVVVGHQPSLGQAAALALTGQVRDWSIRKGAVWWLRMREREGHDEAVLLCVLAPDMI
jgi:phosphohistidine phosphatase